MASLIDTIIKELRMSAEKKFKGTPKYHQYRDDKYYYTYEENLFWGHLYATHLKSFGDAQGGELNQKGDKPAKMSAIRSSSALAVNIFGNDNQVEIIDNQINLPVGKYELKYEETSGTTITTADSMGINRPHRANIDVRLSNTNAEIFIEVKMLEPLSFSPKINAAYVEDDNYNKALAPEVKKSFIEVFKYYNENPTHCFDACQMFKHLLAILDLSIRGELNSKHVVLVNCHWDFETFPLSKIQSQRSKKSFESKCKQYESEMKKYIKNIERLIKVILDARILDNYTIVNCTHSQMIETLDLKPEHKTYLERYSITE